MIGRTLAHYEIRERLGAGGMGEVYRAHDTRLGRDVALKLLPADAAHDSSLRQRLEQEARAVASLSHPNIVTLYSVEEADKQLFLTMELVRGAQLSQLLTAEGFGLPRFLELALPLTEAVGAAHEEGLIHRDLKPANIVIDEKGRLKVLDFGLAKQLKPANPLEDATIQMSLTNPGGIVGTCAYMSPEQAQGDEVDTRSDIFSLGVILYEMACGKRPFVGANPISILSSILKDEPVPVGEVKAAVLPDLAGIIMRCLEKDPSRRWSNATELHNALLALKQGFESGVLPSQEWTGRERPKTPHGGPSGRAARSRRVLRLAIGLPLLAVVGFAAWKLTASRQGADVAANAGTSRHNVVVFPFENLGEAKDDYFADGMTDEIVSRLTAIPGIGVISRTSALRYDRAGKTLAQIAADLNVDFVLEGTIRWDRSSNSNRLRIIPQLVRVEDQVSIWSQSYDRELQDVFLLQSEIARQVVNNIDASLTPAAQQQPTGARTDNLEAYDLYLQAKQSLQWRMGPSQADLLRAAALLERALALDADFAAAHASLSRVSSAMVFLGFDLSEMRVALAGTAADRALKLDPDLAEAHLAKGLFLYRVQRDFPGALEELQLARELAPGDAETLSWIGTLWKRQGQFEKAADILQRALRLDPYNPTVPVELSIVYRSMGEFAKAVDAIDRAVVLDPSFNVKRARAALLESWTGDLEPRRQLLEEDDAGHEREWDWAILYLKERRFDQALAMLDSLRSDPRLSPTRKVRVGLLRAQIFWVLGETFSQHQAIEEILPLLDQEGNNQPHDFRSLVYALLGREDVALAEADLAIRSSDPNLDILVAAYNRREVALTHAILGNISEAVRWLEEATQLEQSNSFHSMRLDFSWDPVRDHPEFVAFMRRLEANS